MKLVARIVAPLFISLVFATAACGTADPVDTNPPANIAAVQDTPIGKSLQQYGYTPVHESISKDQTTVYIFVACGKETNISACGSDMHNKGTMERPNIYVENGKIFTLEGPHTSEHDDRSYYVSVPSAYQDFVALTPEQQQKLLGIMPEIAQAVGEPTFGNGSVVATSIGQVNAWVRR